MRIRQIISTLVLLSVLCCGTVFAEVGTEETANFVLQSVSDPTVSSIGGEWAVMGISRSGIEVPSSYYSEYLNRVYAAMDSAGGDLGRKYTEYSRIAITLLEPVSYTHLDVYKRQTISIRYGFKVDFLRMNLNKEGLYFFVKRHCLGSMLLRIFHIKQDHSESSRTADWVQVEPTKRQKLFNAKSV